MEYPINIDKSKQHKAALSIINCFLKLSDRELELIVTILDNNIYNLDKEARKLIRESMNIDSYGLNNYILKLKNKGYIVDNKLSPKIIQAAKDKEIIVRINAN